MPGGRKELDMRNHLKSGPEPLQILNLWFNKRRQLNVQLFPLFYQLKLILRVPPMYYLSYELLHREFGKSVFQIFNKLKDAGLLDRKSVV